MFRLFPTQLLFLGIFAVLVCSEEDQKTELKKPLFRPPSVPANAYLAVYFSSPSDLHSLFTLTSANKTEFNRSVAEYDGVWEVQVDPSSAVEGDYTLLLSSKAKHHAIATKLLRPYKFDTNELVVQYEVKFNENPECAGAYLKLLTDSPDLDLRDFHNESPFTIMFGPDMCGNEYKFHFIVKYRNPKTGEYEEKKAKKVSTDLEKYFSDRKTHLYTLVLRSDSSFERYIDQVKVQSGSLLTDMEPPINPPAEIDDLNDKRPDDWDDRETIDDPSAVKPDDWDEDAPEYITDESATKPEGWLDDEPETVPDLSVKKPDDWDSKLDGEWKPPQIRNEKCLTAAGCGEWHKPQIKNPKYRGKWNPPKIPNPAYKGVWKRAKIPNPNYFKDDNPFKNLSPFSAVGLELWSMSRRISFDNFLVVDSLRVANNFAAETWTVKSEAERLADPKARSVVDAVRETYREKPVLVLLIGLVLTVPFLFCLWYMCRSSTKTPVDVRKKTDAPTPDDEPTKYDANKTTPVTPSRANAGEADEDAEEEIEDDLVQVPSSAGGDASTTARGPGGKADLESDSNEEDDETKEISTPEKQTIRKRRPRKE